MHIFQLMKNYREIIGNLSGKLTQNGMNYSGNEFNNHPAENFDTAGIKVLICRLSTYRDTSQSFTHPLLYKLISSVEGTFADLAYLPSYKDIETFRKNSIPLLLPVNTKAGPADFDVLAISNSLVQELLNIGMLLSESGIETDRRKRLPDEDQPLIVLGGSNSANCHFLMTDNSPVDIIYTNDDPEDIVRFFQRINEYKAIGLKKTEIIERLYGEFAAAVPGRGESGIVKRISAGYFADIQPSKVPLLFKDDPQSSNLVISRGCPWFCSFCNESFRTKPYSEVPVEEIINSALEIKKNNGSEEISLFSFNFNAHSRIEEIIGELHKHFRIVSLKSQRFDILSLKSEFLKILQFSGKTSITCGLEGISGRMRSYLSKDLSETELQQSLISLLSSPIRTLKIFLIATGLEDESDYNELSELAAFIKTNAVNRPRPPRIVFSLTQLVRFPGTPQEKEKAYSAGIMQAVVDRISGIVTSEGFEFRTAGSVYEYWVSQVLLRNGSDTFSEAVRSTLEETGFIYYNSVGKQFYDRFREGLRKINPDPDSFLNSNLDYRHLNSNISEEFLKMAGERLRQFTDTRTCRKIKATDASCNACGACGDAAEVRSAAEHIRGRGLTVERLKEIKAEYLRGVEITVPVILSEKCAGLSEKYLGAVFTSAVIRSVPGSERSVKRFVKFKNRDKFQNSNLLGYDEAVFLCSFEESDNIFEQSALDEFKNRFNDFVQDFAEAADTEKQQGKIVISISDNSKKIDTSFMTGSHIRTTVIKINEGIYEAQVSKDGLKKRQFTKVLINIPENRIEVSYGEKFDLNAFIRLICDSYKIKPEKIFSVIK